MAPKLRALGLTCGIGGLLLGARQAGFQVVGNVDWRGYYHTGTFERNFHAPLVRRLHDLPPFLVKNLDCVFGHPNCGNYSQLNTKASSMKELPGDIPLFIDMVREVRPKFFVMDNLPGSLAGVPIKDYARALPKYDLFPEMVSNYHYGNAQLHRRRLFIIGALKTQKFVFVPGEQPCHATVKSSLKGLKRSVPNNERHDPTARCSKLQGTLGRGTKPSWKKMKQFISKMSSGKFVWYQGSDNKWHPRLGFYKMYWDRHAHVIDGGSPHINPKTLMPFSIRERARLQGFPDNFVFKGAVLERDGTWSHDRNMKLVKQTGKCMPIQFARYVSQQISDHINKVPYHPTNNRLGRQHALVDAAKQWMCRYRSYSRQRAACGVCWLNSCKMRRS